MANPVLTFTLTAEQWTAAKAAVQQQCGVTLAGNVGDAQKDGVAISYAYDINAQALKVSVLKRAFFDPSVEAIDAKLAAAIAAVVASSATG